MTAKDLRKYITTFIPDLEFEYKGIHGVICAFGIVDNMTINLLCGDSEKPLYEKTYTNVDDMLSDARAFNGKSFNDIAPDIDFDETMAYKTKY